MLCANLIIVQSHLQLRDMYEAIIVILTAAGIQLTFAWNYHRTYVGLHKEFYNVVESIVQKRLTLFREEVKLWMAELFDQLMDSLKIKGKHDDISQKIVLELKDLPVDPKSEKKVKELYNLVSKAEEPKTKYEEARESCKALYKYLLASGLSTLLGLGPQVTGNTQLNVLYFVFLFPLMAVAFSWDTYSKTEDDLVKLRDEGA